MARAPGDRLASFRLVSPIGAGGMGEVWRAVDERSGAAVAVKLVRASVRDEAFLVRFEREARAAQSVSHPNVVRTLEVGRDGQVPFIALELVEGGSLNDLMKRKSLPWREAAALGAGIARGLAAIHAAGLVHRDVKPGNVLIGARGPLVADLGLVRGEKLGETVGGLTKTGEVVGTIEYAAPEQIDGVRGKVSARSDLYALGATLHHAIAGRPPFGETGISLMRQHLVEPPPPLRSLAPEAPAALEALVLRLLAKKPDDRPPSADAVARELDAIASSGGERRARVAWLSVAALAAIATIAFAARPRGPEPTPAPPPPSPPANPPARDRELAPELRPYAGARGILRPIRVLDSPAWKLPHWGCALAASPDGRSFVVGGMGSTLLVCDGESGATLAALDTEPGATVESAAFAPSGTRIASTSAGRIRVHELPSGRVVRSFDHPEVNVTVDVAFLPDGRLVSGGGRALAVWSDAFEPRAIEVPSVARAISAGLVEGRPFVAVGADSGVFAWRPDQDTAMPPWTSTRDPVTAIALAPDGRLVAYGTRQGDVLTAAVKDDIAAGDPLQPPHEAPVTSLAFRTDGFRLVSGASGGTTPCAVWNLQERSRAEVAVTGPDVSRVALLPVKPPRLLTISTSSRLIELWDLDRARRLAPATREVSPAVVAADERRIASGDLGGTIRVHDAATNASVIAPIVRAPQAQERPWAHGVLSLALNPTKPELLVGSMDASLLRFTIAATPSFEAVGMVGGPEVRSVSISPDGKVSATSILAGNDGAVIVHQLEKNALRAEGRISGHPHAVGISSDGRSVVVAGDAAAHLWRVPETDKALAPIDLADPAPSYAAGFVGRRAYTVSKDGWLRLVDPSNGRTVNAFKLGHREDPTCAATSPDGALIATGSGFPRGTDRTLRLARVKDGVEVEVVDFGRDHDWPASIAFSTDKRLVVGTARGAVVVFELRR